MLIQIAKLADGQGLADALETLAPGGLAAVQRVFYACREHVFANAQRDARDGKGAKLPDKDAEVRSVVYRFAFELAGEGVAEPVFEIVEPADLPSEADFQKAVGKALRVLGIG